MLFDSIGIQKVIPHRDPFLMVDAILEMESRKRIVGVKNVLASEAYFKGHFPGNPIMPGVLIIEALAQTGAFLLLHDLAEREKKLLYFVAVDGARFRHPVVPGDQIRLEVDVLSWRSEFYKMHGVARVGGELATEATLMCKVVDRVPVVAVSKK
jgi:3-hydroxyacyl-[acyl-carrier-protein] dehydratase